MLLVMFLVFVVGGAIGAPPHQLPDTKIVNGYTIDISKVPWQVFLQAGKHMCGGSIVNDRWILTAAHCTKGLLPAQVKVRAGSNLWKKGGVEYTVDLIENHPDYSGGYYHNDISAIRTSKPISFVGPVKSVKLPTSSSASLPLNTLLRVSGWGMTEKGEPSEFLKAADVRVADFQTCRNAYKSKRPNETIQICIEPVNGISCSGDSGGPATMGDTLVGIVSLGVSNEITGVCVEDAHGLYTRVSFFRDWIKQITGA